MRFKDFDNKELLDSIEFNEFEKSQFLTKAQEELVISLYTGRNNSAEGFEATEELRRYLSNLVVDTQIEYITNSSNQTIGLGKSRFFSIPPEGYPDVWFIIFEEAILDKNDCGGEITEKKPAARMEITPVTHDEYHKLKKNPFRGANDRRSLRLDLADGVVEIISKYDVAKYHLRYLRKPNPIVLEDFADDLEIEGKSTATPCELHEALHQRILERAVMEALQSKVRASSKDSK